ncbi:class I SAM-dependent methyltransferase [bacterium]|nr:class I SAM-dependent methyltransferase [bacterium]
MRDDYSSSAKTYDPVLHLALKPIRISVMNELLEFKEKAIIDLCCGTGNQLKLLAKNGFKDLHCLDRSTAMLEIARDTDHPLNIYNEDATQTSFENESFDIAIISFSIHEKDRNTQENFIKEAHRIIKKDGIIVVVDFVFDSQTTILAKFMITIIERIAGKEHYNNFKSYIQNAGLSSLIKEDRFEHIDDKRKLFNGVTVSIFKKIARFDITTIN